ncbi:MAG TPA: hypothetical protein DIU35_10290, partial [Candidatus Latescibacteria bacterium]|nr:hypothetical protein [Candidatus Latescibacterota bacterium]
LSPLSSLTALIDLDLNYNQISNLSPLSSLTALTHLYLHYNQISDLSTLSSLTALTLLYLLNNQITDLSPLVNNAGLGSGDTIYLGNNPLSVDVLAVQITALVERGALIIR